MDFALTPEQELVRNSLREFAARELRPRYAYWDRTGEFPAEIWRKMGAVGVLGLRVPEAYGGQNFDCVTAGLAIEEAARGDFNCCYGVLNSSFAGDLLGQHGSESVKREWLSGMVSGEKVLCVCLTEPHCGSDAAAIRTQAERRGDRYVIRGEKSAITLLMAGHAGIVFAKTDPKAGARGVSAFLVPFHSKAYRVRDIRIWGQKASCVARSSSTTWRCRAENMIGPENGAFSRVMQTFEYTRALIATHVHWRRTDLPRRDDRIHQEPHRLWSTDHAQSGRFISRGRMAHPPYDGALALLPHAMAARPGPSAQRGSCDVQGVRPGNLHGRHSGLSRVAWPLWLHAGFCRRAAASRCRGTTDCRWNAANSETDNCASVVRQRIRLTDGLTSACHIAPRPVRRARGRRSAS